MAVDKVDKDRIEEKEMKLCQLLDQVRFLLREAGLEFWDYESWTLLEWKLSISRADYYMDPGRLVTEDDQDLVLDAARVRACRRPLQYMMGECEFMGFPFKVDDRVLIPRQDTELLVEEAVSLVRQAVLRTKPDRDVKTVQETKPDRDIRTGQETKPDWDIRTARETKTDWDIRTARETKPDRDIRTGQETKSDRGLVRVLDLCTGSGAIGISVKLLCPEADVTITDISPDALAVARDNWDRLKREGAGSCPDSDDFEKTFHIIESDLFGRIRGSYGFILSNPPYIPTAVIDNLMPEVRDHEPHLALDGEADGLIFYRRICGQAGDFLREGGRLLMEIGADQGQAVTDLMTQAGFENVKVHQDLAGLDRLISGIMTDKSGE